jgi:hypothetical protein
MDELQRTKAELIKDQQSDAESFRLCSLLPPSMVMESGTERPGRRIRRVFFPSPAALLVPPSMIVSSESPPHLCAKNYTIVEFLVLNSG